MGEHLIIDGNNLLHAFAEHGPTAAPGRETLVRHVERWAKDKNVAVTLVFDGAPPNGPMAGQVSSAVIDVRFSAPVTADDVIVAWIHQQRDPARVRVISGDNAIRHEASLRRCRHSDAASFVSELLAAPSRPAASPPPEPEKPAAVPADEQAEWRRAFGGDDDERFEGYGAMVE